MNSLKSLAITFLTWTTVAFAQDRVPVPEFTPPATPSQSANTAALDPVGFAKEAAAANAFEIASSEVALRRSNSADIKELAQIIIDDYRRAQKELQDSANADNIDLAQDLSMEQKQTLLALEQAEQSQFDSSYLSAQMKAHEQLITLLGTYAEDGPAGGLKTYAIAHYPAVRTHLVRTQSLSAR